MNILEGNFCVTFCTLLPYRVITGESVVTEIFKYSNKTLKRKSAFLTIKHLAVRILLKSFGALID